MSTVTVSSLHALPPSARPVSSPSRIAGTGGAAPERLVFLLDRAGEILLGRKWTILQTR